ncbi:hypothetical protein DVH24_036172 [Malus domestica]|uniref:DOG1 domain-containing protein n=1 Tax=Malus domestica TaxID=3750 RepID=A0A498IK07_MALDO|nr:hypothetical protein DVH24_036172 [Malus domestica]
MNLALAVSSPISITCPRSKSKTKIPKETPHLSNPTSYLIPPIFLFFVAIKALESFAVFVLVMTNGSHSGNASNTFEAFYEGWPVRQEHFLDELLSAQQQTIDEARDEDLRDLVSRVLFHYQQYYDEKSRFGQREVLLVFSPKWYYFSLKICASEQSIIILLIPEILLPAAIHWGSTVHLSKGLMDDYLHYLFKGPVWHHLE